MAATSNWAVFLCITFSKCIFHSAEFLAAFQRSHLDFFVCIGLLWTFLYSLSLFVWSILKPYSFCLLKVFLMCSMFFLKEIVKVEKIWKETKPNQVAQTNQGLILLLVFTLSFDRDDYITYMWINHCSLLKTEQLKQKLIIKKC